MKKRILAVLLLLVVVLSLASCGSYDETKNLDKESRFVRLAIGYKIDGGNYIAIRDTKSDIIYVSADENMDMVVLLNKDGKPYTYSEFIQEYKN